MDLDPKSFLVGFVCAVVINCLVLFFTGFFGQLRKELRMRKRRREIERGVRCAGGILGCPGGKTCTSSHK